MMVGQTGGVVARKCLLCCFNSFSYSPRGLANRPLSRSWLAKRAVADARAAREGDRLRQRQQGARIGPLAERAAVPRRVTELKGLGMNIYADPGKVVAIRLFEEADGTWSVDGLDDEGRYTESCWNFDTKETALAAVDEFQIAVGSTTDRVLVWSEELDRQIAT